MESSYGTTLPGASHEPSTSLEERLTAQHGDLHDVIPHLLEEHSQFAVAVRLGVSQGWISVWLRTHGYERRTVWTRKDGAA